MEFGTLIDSFRLLIGADPFLFWLFLGGIIVAGLQDLKRREVDNWLNLFLLVSGLAYISFGILLTKSYDSFLYVGLLLVVMFGIMNIFYYGRVFAGGDAKLLFAMTALFVASSFWDSMINIGVFVFFLMVAGSVYGMIYSGVLWWLNREKVNAEMKRVAQGFGIRYLVFGSVVLMLLGFVDFLFFLVGILLGVFPFLFVFAKGLENVSMIKGIPGSELREGDWLAHDVVVIGSRESGVGSRRVIKADWEGLDLEDIELLKNKKKVMIKEGLPFVPAFLIAFVGYVFLKSWFISIFIG